MILILSGFADDPTVTQLCLMLEAQAAPYIVLTPTLMEEMTSLTITGGPTGGEALLHLPDQVINLADVHAAWLWRSWARNASEQGLQELAQSPDDWQWFRGEWATFCRGLALTLGYNNVFCVNPVPFPSQFDEKCCQLFLAAQAGLSIPPTLYTSRLPLARSFAAEHNDDIIYKNFRGYMRFHVKPDERVRVTKLYTNRIKVDDLVENEPFVPTPGIFQPYIAKQVELRIAVIGRTLFACAIHSQQSNRSREDWRRYDLENTPYVPYDLPAEVAAKLRHFLDLTNLIFGSIDMIVTPEGEHVFLEINPSGQFGWVSELTGFPIYEHLAAMLIAGRVDYPPPVLPEVNHAP